MPCSPRPRFFTAAYEGLLYTVLGTVLYALPAALLPREPLAAERAVKTCLQRGWYCENYPGFRGFYVNVCVCLCLLAAAAVATHLAAAFARGVPARSAWTAAGKLATGAAVPLALDAGLSLLPLFVAYKPGDGRNLALTVVANSRYAYAPVLCAGLFILVAYAFIQAKAPETVMLVGARRRVSRKTSCQRAAAAGVSCAAAYIVTVALYWARLPAECVGEDGVCQPAMGFVVGLAEALAAFSLFYYAVLGTPSLISEADARCWVDAPLPGDSGADVPAPVIRRGQDDGFGDPTRLEGEYYQPGGGFGRAGRNYQGPAYAQGDPHGTGRKMRASDMAFYQE